ncbi:hypothetical protein IWX48DRAFT_614198 [Phyllosticta citricarpa]
MTELIARRFLLSSNHLVLHQFSTSLFLLFFMLVSSLHSCTHAITYPTIPRRQQQAIPMTTYLVTPAPHKI